MLACARIGAMHRWSSAASRPTPCAIASTTPKPSCVITADGGWRRGQMVAAQGERRRGAGADARRSRSASCCAAPATRSRCSAGATSGGTRLVAAQSADVRSRRAARFRASAVHPLHLGHDRQAQGHRPHDRRLPARTCLHDHEVGLRPQGGRRLLVHRRHRLGHRPQLYRLRAAGERRDGRHVRGRARIFRRTTASGRSSKSTASTSSTPRRPRSAPSSSGATHGSKKHDLSSLRLLGTVGEPINPEAWIWYHEVIGGGALPDRRHLVADRDRRAS